MPSERPNAKAGWSRRRWVLIGLAVAAVVAVFWMLPTAEWIVSAYKWIQGLGPWAFVAFVVIYTILSMLFLPTSPLNVGAGLLFGLLWGFLASLAGVMAASIGCFLLARYAARGWVLKRVACNPKFEAVLRGLKTESWKLILLTRLNPVLPAAVASYCFGVTPIRFGQYALASLIGNIPLCLVLAYLGSAGQLAFGRQEWTAWDYALYGAGFVATIGLTVWASRFTKRKLAEYEQKATADGGAGQA